MVSTGRHWQNQLSEIVCLIAGDAIDNVSFFRAMSYCRGDGVAFANDLPDVL